MTDNYFKLFTNCFIVKGIGRSLIVDIQRENYVTIPNSMEEIIQKFKEKKSIRAVKELYGEDNIDVINEYIDFLIEKEFGFIVDFDEFDLFIEMNTSFEEPSHVTNCIIEVSEIVLFNFDRIINSLENSFCKNLQIVCYDYLEISTFKDVLSHTKDCNFRSIELVLKYSDELLSFISEIDKNNFRVTDLTFHTSFEKNKEIPKTTFNVNFIDYKISSFRNCGIVDYKYFNVNNSKVLESINYNSCLYKKISIDIHGNINNCPSMPQSFGNIKDTTLEEALNHPDFKKYWNVTKDMISVCKDCEFRHVCTDCRAYTERTTFDGDIDLSKPLKCGYNPYTNEWAEWSTNPLKEKAIAYYGMQDLVKKDA
jgi:SPASM domain peptide maturase of grasp-with-spasm system